MEQEGRDLRLVAIAPVTIILAVLGLRPAGWPVLPRCLGSRA